MWHVPILGEPLEGQNFNPARVCAFLYQFNSQDFVCEPIQQIQWTCVTLIFYRIDGFLMPRKCSAPSAWALV